MAAEETLRIPDTRTLMMHDTKGFGMVLAGDRPTVVARVTRKGAAAEAGLKRGDVLLALNGQPVANWTQLQVWDLLINSKERAFVVICKKMKAEQVARLRALLEDQERMLLARQRQLQAEAAMRRREAALAGLRGMPQATELYPPGMAPPIFDMAGGGRLPRQVMPRYAFPPDAAANGHSRLAMASSSDNSKLGALTVRSTRSWNSNVSGSSTGRRRREMLNSSLYDLAGSADDVLPHELPGSDSRSALGSSRTPSPAKARPGAAASSMSTPMRGSPAAGRSPADAGSATRSAAGTSSPLPITNGVQAVPQRSAVRAAAAAAAASARASKAVTATKLQLDDSEDEKHSEAKADGDGNADGDGDEAGEGEGGQGAAQTNDDRPGQGQMAEDKEDHDEAKNSEDGDEEDAERGSPLHLRDTAEPVSFAQLMDASGSP